MENATKALLIAAAVLIAILIISLGLVVYNSSAETVNQANLSDEEVRSANEKFTRYNGANKRSSEVTALYNTVISANANARELGDNGKIVTVQGPGGTDIDENATSVPTDMLTELDSSHLYSIQVEYEGEGGLVNNIIVEDTTN